MDNKEALKAGKEINLVLRVFRNAEEILQKAADSEGETKRLQNAYEAKEQQYRDLCKRVDEKTVELQQMIDSMVETAERESTKSQDALGKLKRHCDEQMNEIRKKYTKDKAELSREIGDLEANRVQLQQAIQKLKAQELELKDRATSRELLKQVEVDTSPTRSIDINRVAEERKKELQQAVAKYADEKRVIYEEISDLRAQKGQLTKQIDKLKADEKAVPKFVDIKKVLSNEVSNLRGQKGQLVKDIHMLQAQARKLKSEQQEPQQAQP